MRVSRARHSNLRKEFHRCDFITLLDGRRHTSVFPKGRTIAIPLKVALKAPSTNVRPIPCDCSCDLGHRCLLGPWTQGGPASPMAPLGRHGVVGPIASHRPHGSPWAPCPYCSAAEEGCSAAE